MTEHNRQWILRSRPSGDVSRDQFEVRDAPIPVPQPGEVLVRNIYLLVPASMRIWMDEKPSYFPPQPIGDVMRGITLGVVENPNGTALAAGTIVNGLGGWQHYVAAAADTLMPVTVHPQLPLSCYRTVLDLQGLTAYQGLIQIGRPQAGETLVVTAAAGSIGSLVGQIGKKLGLKVIGIAGGREKCDWLVRDLGFDGAIDYKHEDVDARLDALCPEGVDVLFENVGGRVMDIVIDRLRMHGRVALCGLVSTYNGQAHTGGRTMMQLINQRALIQGFLALDFMPQYTETMRVLEPWVLDGTLRFRINVLDGLDMVPDAMNRVFRGTNRGIQLVQITKA